LALTLTVAAAAVQAQAVQGGGAPHATRTVQAFTELEESLLQAIRLHDTARLERSVDDDFQMVIAQAPADPVARDDWIDALSRRGAGDWTVQHLSARESGDTAVAGFVLRGTGSMRQAPPLYVVDTWQRAGDQWRLLVRHVAPASGTRRGIPGDGPSSNVPKKY
jgi:hypothetical protein